MKSSEPVRAAIFDLDGTLVDNMSFHLAAWVATGEKLGKPVGKEQFEREFAGRKNEEIFPLLLGREVPPDELNRLAFEKEAAYRELYRPHLRPLAGAEALLDRLAARGVKLALATAAPIENRQMALEGLGWTKRFASVTGGEGKRGKPAPDIFLAAAKALDTPPEVCIAFEDAVQGVRSAVAAGMATAAVLTTTPKELLLQAGARWAMPDFTRLPDDLEALLFGAARL